MGAPPWASPGRNPRRDPNPGSLNPHKPSVTPVCLLRRGRRTEEGGRNKDTGPEPGSHPELEGEDERGSVRVRGRPSVHGRPSE